MRFRIRKLNMSKPWIIELGSVYVTGFMTHQEAIECVSRQCQIYREVTGGKK